MVQFYGVEDAKKSIHTLLTLFEVAPINRAVLEQAMNSSFSDFEDAVLYQAGYYADVDGVVTRDAKGYKKASLPIYTPTELLRLLG